MESQRVQSYGKKNGRVNRMGNSYKQNKRSLSEGGKTAGKRRDVSREPSSETSVKSLDVRCACQYFQSDALMAEKMAEKLAAQAQEKVVGQVKSRPTVRFSTDSLHDHDHEPVHLQQSNNIDIPTFTLNNTPAVVISADQALGSGDQDNYNLSTKHVYEEISEDSQKRSPRPQRVVFSATTDSKSSDVSETEPKPKEGPSRFQAAFKQKADKFKTKLQNFKRPHINFPERPKFQKPNLQRFKIEKPKWNMPKIPDTAKINLPHFSLPRKGAKKPVKRISSTESTSGDSKRITFDFGTYPRIFKKKPKPEVASDFATVPRAKKTDSSKSTDDSRKSATDSIRIPLHSDDSVEKDNVSLPVDSSDLNRSSHIRYDEGIDSEDEYNKETREIMEERDFLSRWQRGRFNPDELMEQKRQHRVTDLDSPSEDKEFSSNNGKDQHYSSGSSVGVGVHRQGVIEEINPDEFFLRQKGISQDNIEVGMYLSTEIREAFRNPTNALVQMEQNNFDKGSHQSLPEMQSKRKPIKKPKRKKTPHASQERFQYEEEETADDEFDAYPPSRPKRRSKRKKKINEEFIPYQETIQVEEARDDRLMQHRESLGILADDERDFMYENEKMEGIEQPEIQITDPYKDYGEEEAEEEEEEDLYIPEAPPRLKPKNIKSLKTFEAGSAVQKFDVVATVPTNGRVPERISYHTKEKELVKEYEPEMISYHNKEKELEEYEPEISYELNITEPEIGGIEDISYLEADIGKNFNNYRYMDESIEDLPPAAPPRRQKSLKSLTISENESYPGDLTANRAIFSSEKKLEEPEIETIRTESKIIIPIEEEIPRPKRPSRSRSRGTGSRSVSQHSLALHSDSLAEENPVPCVEEPCMQTVCDYMGYTTVDRNKPRDPPLPPPRTLQRKKRSKKNQENNFFTVPRSKAQEEADAPVRPLRIYSTIGPSQKSEMENKENLDIEDIMQYIEQDDDRDLQSGEVIEKIKTRPLPTPPRPPRKIRPLSDITSRENIMIDSIEDLPKASTGETEVYTQTEPLPDDFVCEEMVQEATDRVIIPTQTTEKHRVKRELITPTVFTHEETITHGSLIVEPLNGAKILPDSAFTQRSKETLISVHVESDNEETSFIPDEFHKLSNPKSNTPVTSEMDVLKAHKLQVIDLDVDTLTVNKLLADKIVVSEIDSSSIQTNEISSRTGALKVGEISFPPEVLEQIIKSIQSSHVSDELEKPNDDLGEQKKTPIESSPIVKSVSEHNFEVCPVAEPETSEELLSDVSLTETVPVEEISKEMPPIVSEVEEVSKEIPSLVSEEVSLNLEVHESPPEAPHRLVSENVESSQVEEVPREEEPPHRPPRQSERLKPSPSATELSIQEPEVDDEPPPRPPHPPVGYIPSQPPASFYALRAQKYVDENIPVVPRRRRATKSKQLTRSSSEESSEITPVVRRHHRRSSEPSIAQLSGQLIRACGSEANNALKRLITYILNNVFHNEDGKQDLNVMIIIILVLIAGLLLLGYGEERTVVHLHHWEYFNPPKDL
ncbi:unnamed protein product [Psylliodes chrysocephalus]|uniref:Titin n=1 Tax=Psylliodes chrysocephalus TaxID=3402493 RepID=A0A9P0D5Y5_9CUCU|nr:unnamed protein product [Psylliodes chrysocephala]